MAVVIVYHGMYGCETGCCGHIVELQDDAGAVQSSRFAFAHPWDTDPIAFAKALVEEEFGAEHVRDLRWDLCAVSSD